MKYYSITFKDDEKLGVGKTIDKKPLFFPPYEGEITDWHELVLRLEEGDYPDYLSSNFGGRICSERMQKLLDEAATKEDHLQWLSVKVLHGENKRQYYYLHFPFPPNVLHPAKTIFVNKDVVVKPVLNSETIAPYAVFSYPKSEGTPLIVNEATIKKMVQLDLTGVEFNKMPIA